MQLSGTTYQMLVQWREAFAQCWLLDLSDQDGNALVSGIPLVPGHDLLEQFPDLAIPGQLWVSTDGDPEALPTFDNLGVQSHLYYIILP